MSDNVCYGDRNGELIFSISGGFPSYSIYLLDQDYNSYSTLTNTLRSGKKVSKGRTKGWLLKYNWYE